MTIDAYDAGLLNDFGGGDVNWWQDYLRAELGRAHDFYAAHIERIEALNGRAMHLIDRLLDYRVGELTSQGWLRDNDNVRAIVADMAALKAASLSGQGEAK
ncbi:hypothetical protein SLG_21750 [Sphingobium sp. SYK-6]|uniref:hypothetical protein n=1 Tax=Sphingobium sp. (strain NBRC 103272 / SYK-6) TaxID=627192 RepID=UPI00022770AA|nr:hypothetical protein [Sphingobium sp. SYK-6]BAK66850.1 hypothetical protein SLG_21750 [Sphingobium sp. SYK-6]